MTLYVNIYIKLIVGHKLTCYNVRILIICRDMLLERTDDDFVITHGSLFFQVKEILC